VVHGLGHGTAGTAVAAWPAVALVGFYQLLIIIIIIIIRSDLLRSEEGWRGHS
jgi:hypothetical protein